MVVVNGSSVSEWSAFVLRLVIGGGFIAHAYAKLSRGPDAFAAILHALLVPAPHVMEWLTILVELLGGLAVLLGGFISVASVPLAAVLVVAMLTVQWHYGFNTIKLIALTAARPARPHALGSETSHSLVVRMRAGMTSVVAHD